MTAIQVGLALAAALVFLLIGLEELPVRFNVARVARTVRLRARRAQKAPVEVVDAMVRSTRLGSRILLGFAVASLLALGILVARAPPGSPRWAYERDLHLFSLVLVAGLLFLVFAFDHWAPRLLARVRQTVGGAAQGSNPEPGLQDAQAHRW